jgi:hypothetical protein
MRVMIKQSVWVVVVGGFRVGVHERGGQAGYGVDEAVFGVHGDSVAARDGQGGGDDDLALGAQPVADPAQPYGADVGDARGGPQGCFDGVDQGGVDGVHESPIDLPGGVFEDEQDRRSDEQADGRVGPWPADGDAGSAGQYGQGGEAVGAGV